MRGEGRYFNVSIDVSVQRPKSGKAGSSRVAKTQSACIEVDPVPNLLIQNRLEIHHRLYGQKQLFHERVLCYGAVYGCMDFIEERGGFEEASEAANGACSILVVEVGRAQSWLEEIVEGLGS